MEIGNLSVSLGSSLQRPEAPNWGWLKRNIDKPDMLSHQISELLYGLQLEMKDLLEYRVRLSEALQRLQDVQAPLQTPTQGLITPREKRVFQVGSVAWQPPPLTISDPYSATPEQVFVARKLARLQQFFAHEEEGLSHKVQIKVQAGTASLKRGSDEIRLSSAGLAALQSGQDPPVKVLRLPPRFHRKVDILRCAGQAV